MEAKERGRKRISIFFPPGVRINKTPLLFFLLSVSLLHVPHESFPMGMEERGENGRKDSGADEKTLSCGFPPSCFSRFSDSSPPPGDSA